MPHPLQLFRVNSAFSTRPITRSRSLYRYRSCHGGRLSHQHHPAHRFYYNGYQIPKRCKGCPKRSSDFEQSFMSTREHSMASSTNDAELSPSTVLDTLNLTSQSIAISVCLKTCPIHEHCDGSCSGPPIVFEPVSVGEVRFRATVKDRPKMNLPLQLEHPIDIPLESFEYTTIDSEAGEIRLLHVRDAVFLSEPVVVDIVTVKLDDPDMPSYAALSYHWGIPIFDQPIICNGTQLQINESLHNTLKRHRQDHLEKPQFLWVDAICINQSDREELISQILLMRKIYESAKIVFVDFGDAPLQWYAGYDLMYRVKVARHMLKDMLPGEVEIRNYIREHGLLPPLDHVVWQMLRQLFKSPWLKRTWTIQEAALAQEIRCRYGRFTFDWEMLMRTFEFQQHQHQSVQWMLHTSHDLQIGHLNFHRIIRIGMDFRSGRLKPLELLWRTRDCEVSNLNDKVIALLGLFPSRYRKFRPDYGLQPEELFHKFAVHVLQCSMFSKEQGSILSYAGLHRKAVPGKMPSWAPDWTSMSTTGPTVLATIREKPYSAAGETVPMLQSFGPDGDERQLLASLSLLVGTVTHSSSICDLNVETEEDKAKQAQAKEAILPHRQWIEWHEDVLKVVSELKEQEGRLQYDDVEEALARTLLVDDLYTGENATLNSVPIFDPKQAYAGAIASMSAGDNVLDFMGPVGEFKMQTTTACRQRKFAVTDTGYMGLVPDCTEVGDEVHILSGVTVPFVLRARENAQQYTLIGDSYIHGVMDGELVVDVKPPMKWGAVVLV